MQKPGLSFFGVLFLTLVCFSAQAQAQQKSEIFLVAPDAHYTPGRDITAYVLLFRMPAPFGFFQRSWGGHIRASRDFNLVERTRISVSREEITDARGFPSERLTELFRIRLRPKHSGQTMQYGPMQLRFQEGFQTYNVVSNSLTFRKQETQASGEFQGKVTFPPATHREGRTLSLTYTVRCPQSLCNLRRLDDNQMMTLFRERVRLNANQDFWIDDGSVTPKIQYLDQHRPPLSQIQFVYKVQPLRGGNLSTPPLRIPVPIIETTNQRLMVRKIHQWMQTHGVSAHKARQMVQVDENFVYTVNTTPVLISPVTLPVEPSQACQGTWQLSSQLKQDPTKNLKLWHIQLQGNGFLLQADRYLRDMIENSFQQHSLGKALRLSHYRWQLPDQSLSGNITIDLYFSFQSKPIDLPALSMRFVSPQNQLYSRTTPALPIQTPTQPLTERLEPQKQEHRIYINYTRPPALDRAQPVEVWGYQLSSSFPLYAMLSSHWSVPADFQLSPQTKMANVVQRSVTMTPFGRSEQVYSQGIQLEVMVGQAEVRIKPGLFSLFPSVVWGSQPIYAVVESSSELSLDVKTDRSSYYVGEPVLYDVELHCPKKVCVPKEKGFYAKYLSQHLTLPKFDKFSTWKKLEDFKRHPAPQSDWVILRTRIKFHTPSAQDIHLEQATLRFNRMTLIQLYRNESICLFTNQSRDNLLKQAITRDHYNSQNHGGQCSIGTQELSAPELRIPIRTLPAAAKGIRLIGTFRISGRLAQLTYPIKNTTVVDKPFYLLVEIEGDGDLQGAREQIRDQLDNLAGAFRKRSVTTYVELPDDTVLRKEGKTIVQLQIIPEEPTTLTIPSLKLQYYHREEGVLTAQTLPFSIVVEPRSGQSAVPIRRPAPASTTPTPVVSVLSDTDLRPNVLVDAAGLVDQSFSFRSWLSLLLLFAPLGLFFVFLAWHRAQQKQMADPQKSVRQKALRQFQHTLRQHQSGQDKGWQRHILDAFQHYLVGRLSLTQKQITSADIERIVRPHLPESKVTECVTPLEGHCQQLEASLYGGASIDNVSSFLQGLEQAVKTLDRSFLSK